MGIKYDVPFTMPGGLRVIVAVEWWGIEDEELGSPEIAGTNTPEVLSGLRDESPVFSVGCVWWEKEPEGGTPNAVQDQLRTAIMEDYATLTRLREKALRALLLEVVRTREQSRRTVGALLGTHPG